MTSDKSLPLCPITKGGWSGTYLLYISLGSQQALHHDHFWGMRLGGGETFTFSRMIFLNCLNLLLQQACIPFVET